MSTTTILSPTQEAQQAALGPYYGLVYLALANLAYTDKDKTCQSKVTADLQNAVAALPALPAVQTLPVAGQPAPLPGSWKASWGPAFTPDYSNLIYAATYTDSSGTPVLTAVCIRGTDTSTDDAGLLQQILQDTDNAALVSWAATLKNKCTVDVIPGVPKIALGTCKCLTHLLGLTSPLPQSAKSGTITDYLSQVLSANQATPIVVTGHSLGGCQTTVLALYLANFFPKATIVPSAFAPPTAGNEAFATAYNNRFTSQGAPIGNLWINSLDLVPYAYDNMKGILNLWQTYSWPDNPPSNIGPAAPTWASAILNRIIAALAPLQCNYTQPSAGAISLTGSMPSLATLQSFMANINPSANLTSWGVQLMWQHFTPCYWAMISQQRAGTVVPYSMIPSPECNK